MRSENMNPMRIVEVVDWNAAANPGGVKKILYSSGVDMHPDIAYALPGRNRRDWIVNLHGRGSLGDQLFIRQDIRDYWLKTFMELGASILTADLRGNAWMCPAAAEDLRNLIAWIRAEYGAERFVFVSGSMGGTSSLVFGVLHPEDVTSIVACCPATDVGRYHGVLTREIAQAMECAYGGCPAALQELYERHSACANAEKLKGKEILVIHGTDDAVNPVSESRVLAERMRDEPTFEYIEVEHGTHDSVLSEMRLREYLRSLMT